MGSPFLTNSYDFYQFSKTSSNVVIKGGKVASFSKNKTTAVKSKKICMSFTSVLMQLQRTANELT